MKRGFITTSGEILVVWGDFMLQVLLVLYLLWEVSGLQVKIPI